jgi:cytochrome c oxidase subunit II
VRLLPAILFGVVVAHAPMAPIRPAEVQPAVHEVQITAMKFSFAPTTIQVVAGEPVRLVIHSADTVHGFAIRELKIDLQIPKDGAPVTVEFTAPPAGRYEIACSEFCGSGHGQMKAVLLSVAPARPGG